jgi:hypothetical protein
MRYQILRPTRPMPIHEVSAVSLAALLEVAPPLPDCDRLTEDEAARAVRELCPACAVIPIRVRLGAMAVWMMAACSARARGEPVFDFLVRAIPEHDRDTMRITNFMHFSKRIWQLEVARVLPSTAVVHEVEIRSTELSHPVRGGASVGRLEDGRLAITTEIGGEAVSIAFDCKDLVLRIEETSDPPGRLNHHVLSAVGSSFDPNPH